MVEMDNNKKEDDILQKKREELFDSAKKYRAQFEDKWQEYERFYDGKQWSKGQNRPVKNYCFSIVEQEVAILTETRPGTSAIPLEIQHEEGAKVLDAAIESVYQSNRLNIKLAQAVRESLVPGPAWMWVDYNHDIENGNGNVVIKNIPWRFVWVDPSADEIDQAEYAFIKMPLCVDVVKRLYPEKAKLIKPIPITPKDSVRPNGLNPDIARPYDSVNEDVSRYDSASLTEIEEFWFKDYSMEKIPVEETLVEIEKETQELSSGINPDVGKYEDHQAHWDAHNKLEYEIAAQILQMPPDSITDADIQALQQDEQFAIIFLVIEDHKRMHEILREENPKGTKPKYPSFWRRTVWNAKTKLADEAPEVNDGMLPLVPVYAHKVLSSIYGEGDIKNIIHAQKSYNDMDYAEYKALRLSANSGWILDNNSGVDKTTLDNREGIVVEKNQGTEVQRLQPGTVSPQYNNRKITDQRNMEEISGVNEITAGRKPGGVTAAQAIQSLRESSITRVRQKARNIEEYTMLRMGQLTASRIIKYWSIERKLRVYDKNGQLQYIEFDPAKVQDIKYDIRMAPGTTSGVDKEAIFALMKDLLINQLIDRNTFFKVVDVPYKAEILEDIQQQDETNAMLQQLSEENQMLKQQLGIPDEQMQ